MPHTFKAGKTELTISPERLIHRAEQMFRWSPERRRHAVEAAKKRLHGKHPRKGDAATVLAASGHEVGNG
jgi:hypothetical protein